MLAMTAASCRRWRNKHARRSAPRSSLQLQIAVTTRAKKSCKDEYRCPANRQLIKRFTSIEDGKTLHTYWSSACRDCALKAQCTPSEQRRVKAGEHEAVLDAMQVRLDNAPGTMRLRTRSV